MAVAIGFIFYFIIGISSSSITCAHIICEKKINESRSSSNNLFSLPVQAVHDYNFDPIIIYL